MSFNLDQKEFFILLENTKSTEHDAFLFENPVAEIICRKGEDLRACFQKIDELRQTGHYISGYVSYEAGYYLVDKNDFKIIYQNNEDAILLHLYAFKNVIKIPQANLNDYFSQLNVGGIALNNLSFGLSKAEYAKGFETIQQNIKDGNTYQINFTTKFHFDCVGSDLSLYQALRARQKVEFGAFLKFPEHSVLSISPELFFKKTGQYIESKPMKGTFPRAKDPIEDQAIVDFMRQDEKTLSENVMIVDLIRNDISRITQPGSVAVKNLFEIQSYETVHQMISTVTGKVDETISVEEIFTNLFPCGSITGAPKISTMTIIEQIEKAPRGIYTGAIGYITPENDMCFNVPIRTAILQKDGSAELGVGGGIIHGSVCEDEYNECLLKAKFLTSVQNYQLIESMLWEAKAQQLLRLDQHIARLTESAQALSFQCDISELMQKLCTFTELKIQQDSKLRILLHRDGQLEISHSVLETPNDEVKYIMLSEHKIDANNILLKYKTTERSLYEAEFQKVADQNCYDVLFINTNNEITECSRHNIFIEKAGQWFTPPIESGLLGGVKRAELIAELKEKCTVQALTLDDVLKADRIFVTNSVRGLVEVKLWIM
ncbi:aminodeoxychorismate synthase component I [Wohlfahrtiimonas populi]|uniref:aminodeoxychorismate synthase component I n=1 Tax=Wohlfahrtiimonas populi TaxID=1940240 RepID=UPI00098D226B|nr:aminodeoxychorismate synthase component I [Wohlfahrtiimonas populi]